jgi:hypothetical protein
MKRLNLAALLLLFSAALAVAADFGLVLNEKIEEKDIDGAVFSWTQTASPWLSIVRSSELSFYLSLDLSLEYSDTSKIHTSDDHDDWRPLFQVGRSQALWKPLPSLFVEAGRITFEDPLGSVATGLFDGAKASLSLGPNTLNLSALYSGLQYKERAKIVMTQGDLLDYADKDIYFSAKRLLFSAFWQTRRVGNFENILDLGGLVQTDLRSSDEERLHSQYLLGKFSLPLFSVVTLGAGGIFGLKQQDSGDAFSLAGDFSAGLAVPGSLADRISLSWFVSSGSSGSSYRPYFPVTAIAGGEVFTPSLAALSVAKLLYQAKPFDSLYFDIALRYFWRTTREGGIIPGIGATSDIEKDNLGAEFYTSGVWTPLSDLSFSLGWGLFIPDGPVKDVSTTTLWKLTTAMTLSL